MYNVLFRGPARGVQKRGGEEGGHPSSQFASHYTAIVHYTEYERERAAGFDRKSLS